jgi:hypothetical protein
MLLITTCLTNTDNLLIVTFFSYDEKKVTKEKSRQNNASSLNPSHPRCFVNPALICFIQLMNKIQEAIQFNFIHRSSCAGFQKLISEFTTLLSKIVNPSASREDCIAVGDGK